MNRFYRLIITLLVALFLGGVSIFLLHQASPVYAETVITVTTPLDGININGFCSLREAIEAANSGSTVDSCVLSGSGEIIILLDSDIYNITVGSNGEELNLEGDFDIATSMTLRGVGAALTKINGNVLDRVFDIDPLDIGDIEVVFEDLTVENGRPLAGESGGGIRMHDDTLSLTNVVVSKNQLPVTELSVFGEGGGIENDMGILHVTNSFIIDNVNNKGTGGGLAIGNNSSAGAVLNMVNSVVANNRALNPNGTVTGGGIQSMRSQINILNSAIIGNYVEGQAGGIAVGFFEGIANIANTTIANNVSSGSGGGIRNFGTLYLSYSTITNNTASGTDDHDFGDAGGYVIMERPFSKETSSMAIMTTRRPELIISFQI